MSTPTRIGSPAPRRGVSLVEMMIGIVIGMFLVAVMGTMYAGTRSTYTAQESTSRLQENGRFAVDAISRDLRMSGFRGCLGLVRATPVNNTLNTPTALLYNFAAPVWGSRNLGGTWTPALSAPLTGLSPLAAGDILLVRRPIGTGWSLNGQMANGTSPLTITATTSVTQGDLLLAADCAGAVIVQATNANPGASGSIEHTAASGQTPGVSTSDVGRTLSNDAVVWRLQTIIYYLAPSLRRTGQTSLWSYTWPTYDGSANTVELVTGVERMAVTYGADTDGDFAADRLQLAWQVTDWTQIVGARVDLLLSGNAENSATKPQPYVWGNETVVPTDKKLRTTMSFTVSLRNTVP